MHILIYKSETPSLEQGSISLILVTSFKCTGKRTKQLQSTPPIKYSVQHLLTEKLSICAKFECQASLQKTSLVGWHTTATHAKEERDKDKVKIVDLPSDFAKPDGSKWALMCRTVASNMMQSTIIQEGECVCEHLCPTRDLLSGNLT